MVTLALVSKGILGEHISMKSVVYTNITKALVSSYDSYISNAQALA
jgi:hypothetical protein